MAERCASRPPPTELEWSLSLVSRCKKTAFIQSLYYTCISASAQTVMAQRFGTLLRQIASAHSPSSQNLRDNHEE